VAVKDEINDASLGMSPKGAQEAIRKGVEQAVRDRARAKPYTLAAPYTMTLRVRQDRQDRALYTGAQRVRTGEFTFTSSDLFEILNAFNAMK